MIYELQDTSKVRALFAGWQETLIYSCLQRVMGRICVTDPENPASALAEIGDFRFFAGSPDRELVFNAAEGYGLLTPQNEAWAELIESCCPQAEKKVRYAIRKDTVFDRDRLRAFIQRLPEGYELKRIDSELYDMCLLRPETADFVSVFETKRKYLELGRGFAVLKDGQIVSGASSYSRYDEGIEIEVDTIESERRRHLAAAACSALILSCLDDGLYPSWDAQNMNSVRLAEKLGYELDGEYIVYEVKRESPHE